MILILSAGIFAVLRLSEARTRSIRDEAASVISNLAVELAREPLASPEAVERDDVQRIINLQAGRSPILNTPTVDEVLDDAIARMISPLPRQAKQAESAALMAASTPNDRVVQLLKTAHGKHKVPRPGRDLSIIFAILALTFVAMAIAFMSWPGMPHGTLLDQALTTLFAIALPTLSTWLVSLRRHGKLPNPLFRLNAKDNKKSDSS